MYSSNKIYTFNIDTVSCIISPTYNLQLITFYCKWIIKIGLSFKRKQTYNVVICGIQCDTQHFIFRWR
jgi:hypothetical protein